MIFYGLFWSIETNQKKKNWNVLLVPLCTPWLNFFSPFYQNSNGCHIMVRLCISENHTLHGMKSKRHKSSFDSWPHHVSKKTKKTTHQQKKHPTIHHQFGSFYFRPKNHKVSWRKQLKLKIGCAYDIMNCPFWCRLLLFDEPAIMSRSMSYLHYVTEFKHLLWSLMSNSAPVRSGGLFARKCAFLPGRWV